MSKKTGETTSPDRLLRFNGVYGRAQDAKDRDEILRVGHQPAGAGKALARHVGAPQSAPCGGCFRE
jgi:hypothetical protein